MDAGFLIVLASLITGGVIWLNVVSKRTKAQPSHGKAIPLQTVPLEGGFDFLVKGSSVRQSEIRTLGLGDHDFLLNPEPTNQHDKQAVMVQGIKNGQAVHVGYLPKGSVSQELVFAVGSKFLKESKAISVGGTVLNGDSGLIVQLHMPSTSVLKRLLGERARD